MGCITDLFDICIISQLYKQISHGYNNFIFIIGGYHTSNIITILTENKWSISTFKDTSNDKKNIDISDILNNIQNIYKDMNANNGPNIYGGSVDISVIVILIVVILFLLYYLIFNYFSEYSSFVKETM